MSSIQTISGDQAANTPSTNPRPGDPGGLIIEAWAQGYLVGSLVIMAFITASNMRKGVFLHKLILIELISGIWQAFWLFFPSPVDTWWLSCAAILIALSYVLHNIIAWLKIDPFLPPLWSKVFLYSVILSIPYWIVEVYAIFAYFHRVNTIFYDVRPLEPMFREPWWITANVYLLIVIKAEYKMSPKEIILLSPRFGIMLFSVFAGIIFCICDILSVTNDLRLSTDTGINPFWKFAIVFKCLADTILLDDFRTVLDRLREHKFKRLENR